MLIPALFVANAVKSHSAASDNRFDIIIFAEPSEVTDVHRRWMEQRDIMFCDDMDMSRMRGVGKFMERLSPATLMKLSLAEHLADRYDKILYLDCDLTIHDDVASIFSLDTSPLCAGCCSFGAYFSRFKREKSAKRFDDHCHNLGMSIALSLF